MSLLEVRNLKKKFRGLTAVDGCSFEVERNSIVGMIGPNGSGKTTIINCISGLYSVDEGEILFKGQRISGLKPHQVTRMGVGRTFQLTRVFEKMSVLDNLLAASRDLSKGYVRALDLIEFVGLLNLKNEYARNLSYGQRKLVELCRTLMLDPELIVLDEPVAGINPVLTEQILHLILRLRDQGKTFLIVEHNIRIISEISDKLIVLDAGKKIAEGIPKEIQRDEKVIDVYLGGIFKR